MKKILSILLAALALTNISCSTEQPPLVSKIPTYTYLVHLSADIKNFETSTTRASDDYLWKDMDCIYLRFHAGDKAVSGTAVYSQSNSEWTITTNQSLPDDIDGNCEAYYFANKASSTEKVVTFSTQTIVYQDMEGSFILTEDHIMSVKLLLTPMTGRVRFKGKPSTSFAITGLTRMTSYNIESNTFATSKNQLTGQTDAEGDTDYYYVFFTDTEKRQMLIAAAGKGAYLREFGENVLAAGQSGYITLPDTDEMGSWTLVNIDNQQEITLPVVSSPEISNLRSRFATLKAMVSDSGNGTLIETGFIYSTNSNPTVNNGTKVSAGKTAQIETRLSNLSAETTYYVVAYAQNERGTAYGSITSFTTLSTEDGTMFDYDGYGDDEDLNGDSSSGGSIGKDGYGDDEDLNSNSSSGAGIDKKSYDDDDNLNGISDSSGNMSKNGYGNDENWN